MSVSTANEAFSGLVYRGLIIKLNKGNRMAGGSGMVQVCVCDSYTPESLKLRAPQLSCPACRLWPAITRIGRAGEKLFPDWAEREVSGKFRAFAGATSSENGERMGAHPLRRGSARAVLEAGGSYPQLLRVG